MKISIIINNYNYAQFLGSCIQSCLDQSYEHKEIIIVDDGSTDGSRDVIDSFGSCVSKIYKPNGGQGSALNAGFVSSAGEVIIFLDADDVLLSNCLETINSVWRPPLSKIHFNLKMIDSEGNWLRRNYCSRPLPRGDLRSEFLNSGNYVSTPTSGNAFSRSFLSEVMPIPSADWRRSADVYLMNLAPLFGEIDAVDEPLGSYRIHHRNVSSHVVKGRFDIDKCRFSIEREIKTENLVSEFANRLGHKSRRGALTSSYSHLQLRMVHDKLSKSCGKPAYGSAHLAFAQMSRCLPSFSGSLLIKMLCIHCYMFLVLLARGKWAERLAVYGYRKGAMIFGPRLSPEEQ